MDIKVKINNSLIENIISFDIDYDIRSCFNHCTLIMPYLIDYKKYYIPFSYNKLEIEVNSKIIFVGVVEVISTKLTTNQILLQARTATGILTNTSYMEKYVYNKMTLGAVAKSICSHFNILVKTPNGDSENFDTLEFDVNKDIYTQLKEIAKLSKIKGYTPLISANFEGNLIIGANVNNNKIVMNYEEDDLSLVDISVVFNGINRHNKYINLGQFIGENDIKGEVLDEDIKGSREYINIGNAQNIAEAQNVALANKAYNISNSYEVKIALNNWEDKNNNILEVGKNVMLKSSNCLIDEAITFMIEAINFSYDKKGIRAILNLVPRDTYKA